MGQREKIKIFINKTFIFTLLCGASKGFKKAIRQTFEAPKKSVKIKIKVNFYSNFKLTLNSRRVPE